MLSGMTRTRLAAALLAIALPITACGGDGDDGSDGDNPLSQGANAEADIEQAVRDHMDAINDGDIDRIVEFTSQRCRDATSEQEMQEMVDLIDTMYGDITIQELTISDVTENSALVRGTTGIQALDEAGDGDGSPWILEDGAWREDDC